MGGMFLFTKSHVFKSMQSLLIHLHCLGNAGLQKYMFGIKKKMAANDSGVQSVISFANFFCLFRLLKMGFQCNTA